MKGIVNAQRTFFDTGATKDITPRIRHLKKLRKVIMAREDAICEALYADFKKPVFESLVTETQFVLAELDLCIRSLRCWSRPESRSGPWANWPSSDHIYKEPYGTVLIIAPWNYPFQLSLAPLIGAVAAGNTVVLKPSELTPNTSDMIAKLLGEVFASDYVKVVEGGAETSQQLLEEQWDYIFFTGSTRVGKIVYESAAKYLTPVTLELGGKNPCIVDGSAPIGLTAKRIVWGKFLNAGQTCIAPDYILVHGSVREKLVRSLIHHINRSYGDSGEKSADLARIINQDHYDRLKVLLNGEEILYGGTLDADDRYIAPTLVNEPKADGPLMRDEIFGPILPILSYTTDQDIADHLQRYGKPLATYVFSTRKSFQKKILRTYSFGGGAINDTVVQITNKELPFGGVGTSGIGAYHGRSSFDLFSHRKAISKKSNWIDVPLRYPPYTLPEKIVKLMRHLF